MKQINQILNIAKWEIRKLSSTMNREVLPVSVILFILLIVVSGYTAQSGMHLQDNLYKFAIDDPEYGIITSEDNRFQLYQIPEYLTATDLTSYGFDAVISDRKLIQAGTEKAAAATKSIERNYERYRTIIYNQQDDIFAAYPLWIDTNYITSPIDFVATQSGQQLGIQKNLQAPEPENAVKYIEPPSEEITVTAEELKAGLVSDVQKKDNAYSRYTDILSSDTPPAGKYKTPSMLAPPLPFDSIIFIFVFIFPLYFTSQFLMMSVMNERTLRQGEPLIAAPVSALCIITGKCLPYATGMLLISVVITLITGGSLLAIPPLIPVILFFLSTALLIGMLARSYKELSFISIFFSTVATSYLFFPSIFANVHIVSLLSPVTLVVMTLQDTNYTLNEYLYSTSLFYLTSIVIFCICIANFREELLFSQKKIIPKFRDFISEAISASHPWGSLFILNIVAIPFVFMAQMMYLVLFFNLPMPASVFVLIVLAALTEEIAKSAGIMALKSKLPFQFTYRNVALASGVTALGFLAGEKLMLFITISQITDSVFGSVMFLSLGLLWLPFLLHMICTLCVGTFVKYGGTRAYIPGIAVATVIHCTYNLYFLRGLLF